MLHYLHKIEADLKYRSINIQCNSILQTKS